MSNLNGGFNGGGGFSNTDHFNSLLSNSSFNGSNSSGFYMNNTNGNSNKNLENLFNHGQQQLPPLLTPSTSSYLLQTDDSTAFNQNNLNEMMSLHLNEYYRLVTQQQQQQQTHHLKQLTYESTNEASEYNSSPSKSSSNEFSTPEISSYQKSFNGNSGGTLGNMNQDSLTDETEEECGGSSGSGGGNAFSKQHITKLFVGNVNTHIFSFFVVNSSKQI
jgi:hypothetical protein